jgi:hypothetical protein
MPYNKAIFEGLVFDENGKAVAVAVVGVDPCYVVDDNGFLRHISSEIVDRQVIEFFKQQIEGNEDLFSEQAAKMLGQDDLFSFAMIKNQFQQIDQHFENLLQTGLPEEARAYLGMMGFKIVINVHGEIIELQQPSAPEDEGH